MQIRKRHPAVNALVASSVVGVLVLTNACGDSLPKDPLGTLCCTDFKPGADFTNVNFGITDAKAAANVRALAQFAGDINVSGGTFAVDIFGACENLARDFGATDDQLIAETNKGEGARIEGMCALAVARIQASVAAGGTLAAAGVANLSGLVRFDPPKCEINANFQAKCEASCTARAECQLTPAQVVAACEPGNLSGTCEASCTGTCEGSVNAKVACEGSCDATCEGSCSGTCEGTCEATAQAPSIQCEGTCTGSCNGQCEANGNTTNVNGRCEGVCKGQCNARCEPKPGAAAASCSGKCEGKCNAKCTGRCAGSCKAEASATVKCDAQCKGGCSVEYKAPKCTAKVTPPQAECKAEAKCEGNCTASANARAECTPPSVSVNASLSVTGEAAVVARAQLRSIQSNLGAIVGILRGQGPLLEARVSGFITGDAKAIAEGLLDGDIGAYGPAALCFPLMGDTLKTGAVNLVSSIKGAVAVGALFNITKGT